MNEPKRLILGPNTYIIGYAPASVALRAGAKLASVLAPAFAEAKGEGTEGRLIAALERALADEALPDLLDYLTAAFSKSTQVLLPGGTSATLSEVFEVHFQGRLGDLVQWLAAALEHNLRSFFEGLPALLAGVGVAQKVSSSSPPQS